jgi:DNA adenine methylase
MSDRPDIDPLLKWAGGKRWLAPKIKEAFESYLKATPGARLVDPFAGGLSIPLGVKPARCLASDMNPHLMNLYRYLQAGLEWDENTGVEFENDHTVYYENRGKFNALCASREYWTREGALLFYYLNRTCFNGVCRFNSDGYFNVPFGKYKSLSYRTNFYDYKPALVDWQLYYGDFATLPLEETDFLYLDPPYDVEFTKFVPRDFTWDDQERMAAWAANHPGPVIISNAMTYRVCELYGKHGFSIFRLEGPRFVAANGDRTPADEILAFKKPR